MRRRGGRDASWQTAGVTALAGLAALLPFELKRPLFTAGPLAITSVELGLYLLLLGWGLTRTWYGLRGLRWTAAHTAVSVWAGVLVLSAICAPAERGDAVKAALRNLGGCALFFAAADLVRTPARAATVMLAVAAGGVVSALAALAEVGLEGVGDALLAFKTQTTLVGSFVRAGGTFQYANIAAMYWEAALPLLLGLCGWWAPRRSQSSWRWAGLLAALIMAEALVLSASRAGLLVAAAVLLTLGGLSLRHVQALRVPAAVGLGGFAALTILSLAASPWLALRFRTETSTAWLRAAYVAPASLDVEAGAALTVPVTVRNDGLVTWPAGGSQAVQLSYHWHDPAQGRIVVFDGLRTRLPADVAPGRQVTLAAPVLAPPQPGAYTLQWDMVQEGVLWFSAHGDETGNLRVQVRPAPDGAAPGPLPPAASLPDIELRPTRAELWRVGRRMWRARPWLGVGPDNFRRLYGTYADRPRFDQRVHANSLYVETLATTGLAGGLALIGLMAALGWAARRAWGAARDVPSRALVAGLLAGLATFFLHGLVDYFLPFTPTYGLFWVLAGATTGLASGEDRVR
jgi:O-Antigen ligase